MDVVICTSKYRQEQKQIHSYLHPQPNVQDPRDPGHGHAVQCAKGTKVKPAPCGLLTYVVMDGLVTSAQEWLWAGELYNTILYYTILYYTLLYYTILYYTILYYTILYYTILYYTIRYYTMIYYTLLYYTILYYTILYYTILYYTILHYILYILVYCTVL